MLPVQGVLILISSPKPLEVIEPGNRMLPLQLVESVVNCHLPVRSIRFSGCEQTVGCSIEAYQKKLKQHLFLNS